MAGTQCNIITIQVLWKVYLVDFSRFPKQNQLQSPPTGSSYASDIDAGNLFVAASAYLQTEDVERFEGADYAQLSILFLDGTGALISSITSGWTKSDAPINVNLSNKTLIAFGGGAS